MGKGSGSNNTLYWPPFEGAGATIPLPRALVAAWKPDTFTYGGWHIYNDHETYSKDEGGKPGNMLWKKNLCQATMCYHYDDWLRVGGYTPVFEVGYEDWAFQCALAAAGVRPVRLNEIVYNYTQRRNGRRQRCQRMHGALHRLLREHYPSIMKRRS